MRNYLLVFVAAFFFVCAANSSYAEEIIPPLPIAKAELLVDSPTLKSGNTFWAAVKFTLPKGWHIYWQNPGDSGMPTTLAWTTRENIDVGEIQWPTPQRIEVGGLMNYGYSNEVILSVPMTVTGNALAYSINTISVKANWLVCRETCIPESATLFPSTPHNTQLAATQIAAARNQLPTVIADKDAATYTVQDDAIFLNINAAKLSGFNHQKITYFIPQQDGIISNAAPQKTSFDAPKNQLTITMRRGSAEPVAAWQGILVNGKNSYALDTTLTSYVLKNNSAAIPSTNAATPLPLLLTLTLAFIGGLLLNIMPCVLPILSLKALTLVKKSAASPALARAHGFAYTFGVVGSFVLIAGAMLLLRLTGEAVGWGFQLQSPIVVFILFALMLAVSANLFGLFELPVLLGGVNTNHENLRGSVLTGVLAVAVATPCTAPFMAGAIGATLLLPAPLSLLVFSIMGLGMAAPFLLISIWPNALRILPRPGAWMVRFKQLLAIPMLLTALWLLSVLIQLLSMKPDNTMPVPTGYSLIAPEPYSPERLHALRLQKTPVLVDVTAAWCITCKVNEQLALKPLRTQTFLRDRGVKLLIADWTHADDVITQYLEQFGRNGVPLYVAYPAAGEPVVLPQLITPSIVINALSPTGSTEK